MKINKLKDIFNVAAKVTFIFCPLCNSMLVTHENPTVNDTETV